MILSEKLKRFSNVCSVLSVRLIFIFSALLFCEKVLIFYSKNVLFRQQGRIN